MGSIGRRKLKFRVKKFLFLDFGRSLIPPLFILLFLGTACAPNQAIKESVATSPEGIAVETLLAEIETLSSDAFEGRGPGSDGEARTIAYLTEAFESLGALPGNPDGRWVQDLSLIHI